MSETNNIYVSLPAEANDSLADPGLSMFWKNYKDRTLWIDGEICGDSMSILDYVIMFNREDKDIPIEERQPIKILINSPGGELDVAESVISLIEISTTPIYTYNMGLAASAASLIYLSGHKKFAIKNATWIFHQGSASMSGDYDTMMRAVEDYQKSVEKMVKFYIEKTNISESTIREKIKQDWYLYATDENIIEDGVCDIIMNSISDIL